MVSLNQIAMKSLLFFRLDDPIQNDLTVVFHKSLSLFAILLNACHFDQREKSFLAAIQKIPRSARDMDFSLRSK